MGQCHVYHCVTSSLLAAAHKHPGTEETGCWTSGRGMLSQFCLIQNPCCSTVLGFLCCMFCFMIFNLIFMSDFHWFSWIYFKWALAKKLWMSQWTVFTELFLEVFLGLYSDLYDRIMTIYNAELPEGLKITGIKYWFSDVTLCPQKCLQIFWISFDEFLLMTLCTADRDILKILIILHYMNIILK